MSAPPDRLRTLAMCLRHPRLSPRHIRDFQNRRLRQLVAHAYESVPFYRDLYRSHGVHPRDIRGVDDLPRLPLVEKRLLQAASLEDRVARGVSPDQLVVRKTSGSSGRPLDIRRTWLEERTLGILRLRAMHEFGFRPTDRQFGVLMNHAHQRADVQVPMRIARSAGLLRMERIGCLEDPRKIVDALCAARPDVVTGFPGVLARAALLAASLNRRFCTPRMVITGGETITPLMRRQIEDGFNAPLYDTYGCCEFNVIAWQCKTTGVMHTCDDGAVTEVLDGGGPVGPGGRGELVATGLHSFTMPLIRYRLGDIVTRGAARCACGSPFGVFTAIQGRMVDYLVLPDGRLLHPWELISGILTDQQVVREYQLLQETKSRILIRIVPAGAVTEIEQRSYRAQACKTLGPGVDVELRVVDRIPLEATGKFRTARSLVHSNYDAVDWTSTTHVPPAA